MSKAKETSRVWSEEVFFVDCPYCENVNELGSGVVVTNGEEHFCEECDKGFILETGEK